MAEAYVDYVLPPVGGGWADCTRPVTKEMSPWLSMGRSDTAVDHRVFALGAHATLETWGVSRNVASLSRIQCASGRSVAVGTALAIADLGRPPHRSGRAGLPHWALALGGDAKAVVGPGVYCFSDDQHTRRHHRGG